MHRAALDGGAVISAPIPGHKPQTLPPQKPRNPSVEASGVRGRSRSAQSHTMLTLVRYAMMALELLLWVPLRIIRFVLDWVVLNPRLGPLRHVATAAILYVVFALTLVYLVAPIRGVVGRAWLGESIRYSAERWLSTAIYDASGNFVGTFDPRLDSKRDVNYTGKAIEIGDYVANPDHKSIPVREVPEDYWRCLVYHEDRNMGTLINPFGIDLVGVLKIPASSLKRSVSARRLRLGVGGSTLPMQLARVIYKTPPHTGESAFEKLRRKFGEWWIAPVIYAELTRGGDDERLKQWAANHLWLAQRAGGGPLHGVEVTSRVVFGKESQDLSAAEQFVLASAVNRPIILQEGNEQLNKVRLDHWRYIIEVRARKCAEVLIEEREEQAKVLFELVNMAGGPPDPVVRPKLQTALEEHAPAVAKQAIANPVLRANVLIPDARYGVREEMKNEFGYGWRDHVREVNLTLDAVDNRTFREKIKAELAQLQARHAAKIDGAYSLDLAQVAKAGGHDKRVPNVIVVAANEKGEIVRYFEADDMASYFGSPNARDGTSGRYEADREGRQIASVGKMIAGIALANEGRDTPETLYTDATAPETGLESCRKGNGTLTRGRAAKVAFACSLNRPLEWRLAQVGQEPVRALIRDLGLTMPRALQASEATPPSTAAVRGLVGASPQKVHQMASVVLASLTGHHGRHVRLPTMVRRWDLNDAAEGEAPKAATDIVPSKVIRREAVPLLKTFLQAPLCYRAGPVQHGTLKSLANWCAETRSDLKLHFAKTGTSVTEDPDATVDAWLAGGIQFASGAAYSYVVVIGTGNTRQPWARKLHASDVAAPLAQLLLADLAEHAHKTPAVVRRPAPKGPVPVKARPAVAQPAGVPVSSAPQPGTAVRTPPIAAVPAAAKPAKAAGQPKAAPAAAATTAQPKAPKRPWGLDEATRRAIFSSPSS
jgi:membrane peptidoglycan carboxypeptidase